MIGSLLYVSSAELKPGEAEAEVDAIVAVSLLRNSGLGVTGALVYTQRNFAQYLEGPPDALTVLMDSIRRDSRHRDVDIVYRDEGEDRRFPAWAMAYAGPSTFVAAHVRSLVDTAASPGLRKASDRLIQLMRQFVEAQLIEERRIRGQG